MPTDPFRNRLRSLRRLRHSWTNIRSSSIFIFLGSLTWLLLRTGRKPTRITYPCQRVAAANVITFAGALPAVVAQTLAPRLTTRAAKLRAMAALLVLAAGCCFYLTTTLVRQHSLARSWSLYQKKAAAGPMGRRLVPAGGRAAALLNAYAALPAANFLSSPHRVVSVHDSNATTWRPRGRVPGIQPLL